MLRWISFCLIALATQLFPLASASAREAVAFDKPGVRPGTIVVSARERRLYLVTGPGKAIRYPVAVGRRGKQWQGQVRISGKYVEPAWSPPAEIKRDNPKLPDVIPGGTRANPMGARAMTLSGGGQYAIHGTNQPRSIGTFASYGCVRMYNDDIIDLYGRVGIGTPVVMLP
ncbi:ErfK/YbiS/YcfS/YnhG family protein [Ancylobacter novellus DSM 506]|uniref:ErfK/YbiS/YcfS/YnhG family protein n=1 Tax=Ancylobacter novellus (strain ATCC 8093 / DSM 506 / JCM 20403 / CCM 1077 / IAM 12100 / NBRC 12443 / NCIMB 10456) TaxID=639283 RepID=D7A7Y2_ANCN5|nr:L,D-transpeptidase [Ancylobacter novellus]ADH90440.1 ErfK/YbiS/YcfS/YnhG family protein [Ancylobacter novellus DSM 506]